MNLQKLSKIALGLVAISMFVSLATAGGNYKLAYRMQKGKTLKYKLSMDVDQSREMQGREMSSTVKTAGVIRLEVEDVGKDGNIMFTYAMDSLRTQVKAGPMDTTFTNPEEVIGKRTRQIITAYGKKLKSVVVDSIKLTGMMAQMGGRSSSFRLIELPENEMKTGDTWSVSVPDTVEQGGMKIVVTPNITYTLAAEVDTLGYKCLRIPYNGRTTIKGEGIQMGMNLFLEGEGPTRGTAYFAFKAGVLVAMVYDSDLEMTIALTGQMSMTMPQSTATKVALVLVK